jgi:hypothetical protein
MLLANFSDLSMLMLIAILVSLLKVSKKVVGSNSEVVSAVKGAATKKAVGFIGRLFK